MKCLNVKDKVSFVWRLRETISPCGPREMFDLEAVLCDGDKHDNPEVISLDIITSFDVCNSI